MVCPDSPPSGGNPVIGSELSLPGPFVRKLRAQFKSTYLPITTTFTCGYKERGNINTPLELAILNQGDRFNLAIDVIDRVPASQATAAHAKEWLKEQMIDSINDAHENRIDREQMRESGSGRETLLDPESVSAGASRFQRKARRLNVSAPGKSPARDSQQGQRPCSQQHQRARLRNRRGGQVQRYI